MADEDKQAIEEVVKWFMDYIKAPVERPYSREAVMEASSAVIATTYWLFKKAGGDEEALAWSPSQILDFVKKEVGGEENFGQFFRELTDTLRELTNQEVPVIHAVVMLARGLKILEEAELVVSEKVPADVESETVLLDFGGRKMFAGLKPLQQKEGENGG